MPGSVTLDYNLLEGGELTLAEIGTDMGRFGSAAHLASWARVCPGTDESAGKRGSGKTGPGNKWLRTPARLSG